jgi:hypothetical protein
MKETNPKTSAMQKLIAEMSQPHITASGKASLQALAKTQKTFPKR